MGAFCQERRSCPWVKGGEQVTVARCVGGPGEGVNSWSVLDGVRSETKWINAVKPVSNFFLVPSLPLWEAPKPGMVQWDSTIRVFEDARLVLLQELQTQSLRGAAKRDVQRQTCGQRQSGWCSRWGLCAAVGLQPQTEMIGQIQFHWGSYHGIKGSF